MWLSADAAEMTFLHIYILCEGEEDTQDIVSPFFAILRQMTNMCNIHKFEAENFTQHLVAEWDKNGFCILHLAVLALWPVPQPSTSLFSCFYRIAVFAWMVGSIVCHSADKTQKNTRGKGIGKPSLRVLIFGYIARGLILRRGGIVIVGVDAEGTNTLVLH